MTSYNLYFASGNSEACYLAPERFNSKGKDSFESSSYMDIFSTGCVIAELFMDGAHLFTLPQILAYKKQEIDVANKLSQVPDIIKEMIINMIQVNPLSR